jgi:predicted amidohydrolase
VNQGASRFYVVQRASWAVWLTIAIDVEGGQLHELLAPIASDRVATILGFTEIDRGGRLYNSAAVFHNGSVVGIYRKLYTAINRSRTDKMPIGGWRVDTERSREPL